MSAAAAAAGHVAVAGAGTIGVGWSLVFAAAGRRVVLFEPDRARRDAATVEIKGRLAALAKAQLVRDDPTAIEARVSVVDDLGAAVDGAVHVQECGPENLDVKRDIFAAVDVLSSGSATVASSSSAIPASAIAAELAGRQRCMVLHPANPPYLLRVVEVVPAEFTDVSAVERAAALLRSAGMTPITVRSEIEGFVFNRLQGALLREAYCLVRDGVISAPDVDTLVTMGLGRRWSVIGPFTTAELNTRGGIREHARRLGPAYARMGAERGQDDPWTDDLVERVASALESGFGDAPWEERVRARDRVLMEIERCLSQPEQA